MRHKSKDHRVLTTEEDCKMRHMKTDIGKADEAQAQLMLRTNIDASHRLKDMQGLDYRTAKLINKKVFSY